MGAAAAAAAAVEAEADAGGQSVAKKSEQPMASGQQPPAAARVE